MNRHSPWKRFLIRWFCILSVLYLFIVIIAKLAENKLVFIGAGKNWESPGSRFVEKTIPVGTDSAKSMACWWYPTEDQESPDAVIFFNGNGGCASNCGTLAERLQKHLHCNVLLMDYPGYVKNDGPTDEQSCYEYAAAGIEWLIHDRKIPATRISVMGLSLGGGVAVEMATRYPVRSAIIVSSYTSLPDAAKARFPFLPTHWLMTNRFDSISKIKNVKSPVLIAHGTVDRTIPYIQGETLFQAANEPKMFLRMDGLGHNDCLNEELMHSIKQLMERNH